MPSITSFWVGLLEWFQDYRDRTNLILSFNKAAKEAFILNAAPVALEARVSKGDPSYHHQFSKFNSGFRIKALAGHQLSRQDTINIGEVIMANKELVRRLVVLGFDTLEVHSDIGAHGCKWRLRDSLMITSGGQGDE